jgi:two-component system phosphate regulon sensor histidine kinase PhoR
VQQFGNDEIGLLGATINSLADELAQRIATLAEQRAQLGAMIAGLYEGVFAVDDENRLIFNNKAARKLLRLDKATTEGPVWELIDVPGLEKMCARAAESGRRAKKEITINRDGAEMLIEARANSFEGDGQRGVVVVLQDVTALRRLERMRTEFVANVSHELKTPLTSIRGYVETLIGGAIHDDAHNLSFLGKINQQVDRLTSMVQDVLALARIEAMEAQTATQPTDWCAIVERVVDDYRQAGKLQRHRFSVNVPDYPLYVDGEQQSMLQVLDNLLDNALKYTPAGGAVTVTLNETQDQIELEVADTGIGMSLADRERIFERFFRADRARSRDTGGTGLGLAIVKHLVQSLGGAVRVESELGEGSRFLVSLPRIVGEEELSAAV